MPLFVRSFYGGCFTGPLQSLTADRQAAFRKFIILGNPGSEYVAYHQFTVFRFTVVSSCHLRFAVQ